MAEASRSFEGSCASTATAEEVWRLWTDPAKWPGGPIVMAELHGSFELGGKITTRVKGNRRLTSTITRIEAPRLWTGVAKAPGVTMTIEHVIDPTDTGTLLTERMTLTGPLASLVARTMGRRIESTFAATTAHAAQVAETHGNSQATA